MEVILDNEQKPRGVFLPLTEWDMLKHGINSASELYKLMDELSQTDVFDMEPDEFSKYLAPVAEEAVRQALDNGLYLSYPAEPGQLPGTFIHEYKNGKKVLVKVDSMTGKEHFIKNL